eukprot:Sspe_Gene.91128::Locus_62591_Transcript_1_1_Confidence_1.000_Length_992::g.91128::m.91128
MNSGSISDPAVYTGVIVIGGYVFSRAFVRVWRPHSDDPWNVADTLLSLPLYVYLAYLATRGAIEYGGTAEMRWTGTSETTYAFLWLYVYRSVVHMPMMFVTKMTMSHRLTMCLHHALSAVCYGLGIWTGRLHFFGCLDGMCEISTVFLNNVFFCKELRWDTKYPLPYAVNGVLLWLTYLVFRIFLFPAWLYIFFTDHFGVPGGMAKNMLELTLYPFVNVFLLVVSTKWMIPITKGMMKALRSRPDDFKPEKQE